MESPECPICKKPIRLERFKEVRCSGRVVEGWQIAKGHKLHRGRWVHPKCIERGKRWVE